MRLPRSDVELGAAPCTCAVVDAAELEDEEELTPQQESEVDVKERERKERQKVAEGRAGEAGAEGGAESVSDALEALRAAASEVSSRLDSTPGVI